MLVHDILPSTVPPTPAAVRRRALRFNALLALITWTGWIVLGRGYAWHSLLHHWQIAVTMIFGSLVGGGTSEGGAAVAFPVFTKALHIPPSDARLFSFAIQTVGMGAASLSILYQRIPIERRVIPWAGTAGVVGLVLSTYLIVPHVPAPLVKISFTVMVSSLAVVLLLLNRRDRARRNQLIPIFGTREKLLLLLAGLVGGAVSALVGCGENIVAFMLLVVLFRVSEKVATPTTVILMTLVTTAAFALHVFALHDFPPRVTSYWLAAVPIVAVGAPLGAFVCARISRGAIVKTLVALIALEFITTLLLIPMSRAVAWTAAGTLLLTGLLNWQMSRIEVYSAHSNRD